MHPLIAGFARQLMLVAGRFAGRAPVIALLSAQAFAMQAAEGVPAPPKLKPQTIEAFDHYVKLTEARNNAELRRGAALLWVDELREPDRSKARADLNRGEVRLQALETKNDDASMFLPGGMIHHWVGAAFITGAKLRDVLGVLQDYDRHAMYYAPEVERSKLESRDGDHFRVYLRFRRRKVITVALNTEHDVRYFIDSATQAHSRSSAIRIAEVENPGGHEEREKPVGDDNGFLWRMETWWRIIECDGGVYVQSEVVSLTRDIPAGLGWLIGPFVTSVPKESLTFTLEATRKAVKERTGNAISRFRPGGREPSAPGRFYSVVASAR